MPDGLHQGDIPILKSRCIDPLRKISEWVVYDRQRPIGCGMCVVSGRTSEEAKQRYREYRDYSGDFMFIIGELELTVVKEGALYSSMCMETEDGVKPFPELNV